MSNVFCEAIAIGGDLVSRKGKRTITHTFRLYLFCGSVGFVDSELDLNTGIPGQQRVDSCGGDRQGITP